MNTSKTSQFRSKLRSFLVREVQYLVGLFFVLLESPKSSINADLYIERADLADWVVKNICLPKDKVIKKEVVQGEQMLAYTCKGIEIF